MQISLPLIITISKYAFQLIKAGKAVISSGGVRLRDGQFVELFKPMIEDMASDNNLTIDNNITINNNIAKNADPLSFRSVNAADLNPAMLAMQAIGLVGSAGNLAFSYVNGQKLNKVISLVTSLQKVAWAGTAIGAATLALGVANFAVVNTKLNDLSRQITSAVDELKREMRQIQLEDRTLEIMTLIDNLRSTANILSAHTLSRSDEIHIEDYLNRAKNLMLWLKEQFERSDPAISDTLFNLLFDLTAMYAQVLREYAAQYYYLEDRFPGNYSAWRDVFDCADSRPLQHGLKRTLWLNNPVDTTDKLSSAYNFSLNTLRLEKQQLEEAQTLIPQMPREAWFDLDGVIKQKIENNDVEVVDQPEAEDPRERVLLYDNGYAKA